jgi:hypothetical protein
MCVTSGFVGQPFDPNRSTMYVPMKAVKNMISVPRNSHKHSLELGIAIPILMGGAAEPWEGECDMFLKSANGNLDI